LTGTVVLGVDPGTKRIGLAISDPSGIVAMPLAVIDTDKADFFEEAARIVNEKGVTEIVVGLPLRLDGSEGPAAKAARETAAALKARLGIEVHLLDERMTSVAANKAMEKDLNSKKRRGKVDQVAAALLLQSYLDSRVRWTET
jgi:putative pre-16S rRNA nuclease